LFSFVFVLFPKSKKKPIKKPPKLIEGFCTIKQNKQQLLGSF